MGGLRTLYLWKVLTSEISLNVVNYNQIKDCFLKIAILLTSNDTSEFTLRFPNDGDKFISLLAPLRPAWDFHVIPVMDNVFPG